jgi:Vesicle coat complex COPII, subunit SEC24/subunit SFB2/subunit SFB3
MYHIADECDCWCSSKKKYKDCCGKIHKLLKDTDEKSLRTEYIAKQKYIEILELEVAKFIQYLVLVKSHTEPLMLDSPQKAKTLIDIDINALSELLNNILRSCKMYELEFDFPKLINRSKDLFFCAKWHKKVEYFLLIWFGLYKKNTEWAIQYINDQIDISSVDDHELLELILDIYSEKLTLSEIFDICHKIQQLNTDPLKISHYIAVEGIQYLVLGDEKKAIELLEKSVSIILKSPRSKNIFNNESAGKLYSLLGALKSDESLIRKAINEFTLLLSEGVYSNEGISNIYWEIGNAYSVIKEYSEAIENYNKATNASRYPIALIDMANTYIKLNEYSNAKNILDDIDYKELADENKKDFLFGYSKILCNEYNEKIDFVIDEIKKCEFKIGIFKDNAQRILIILGDIKSTKNTTVTAEQKRNWIDNINDSIMLQPNIAGCGINLNKIIELIRRRK